MDYGCFCYWFLWYYVCLSLSYCHLNPLLTETLCYPLSSDCFWLDWIMIETAHYCLIFYPKCLGHPSGSFEMGCDTEGLWEFHVLHHLVRWCSQYSGNGNGHNCCPTSDELDLSYSIDFGWHWLTLDGCEWSNVIVDEVRWSNNWV